MSIHISSRICNIRYFFWKYHFDSFRKLVRKIQLVLNMRKSEKMVLFFTLVCTRYYLQAVPMNIFVLGLYCVRIKVFTRIVILSEKHLLDRPEISSILRTNSF